MLGGLKWGSLHALVLIFVIKCKVVSFGIVLGLDILLLRLLIICLDDLLFESRLVDSLRLGMRLSEILCKL